MMAQGTFLRVLRRVAFVAAVCAAAACNGNGGGGSDSGGGADTQGGNGGPDRNVTQVWGKVFALAGTPLPGVTVRAGSAVATTGQYGDFELDAPVGDQVLRFEKDGFLPTVKKVTVLDGKATAVEATMRPMAAAVSLDAGAGGTATGDRGAALTAAAGALVDSAGTAVTGAVDVHLTPFDPSRPDELAALPGALEAETAAGDRAVLESFGVLDVTVLQNGQELDVAAGQTVTIRIPAPEGGADPPATIPIWSFDEAEGIWKEEGTGTYVAADGVYEAQIGHLSYWNCDRVAEATCITGRIVDGAGAGVGGAHVVAGGVDYVGTSTATADADGRFCVAVRKSSRVRISASDGVGGLVQQEVTSGADDTSIPPTCGDPRCKDVGSFAIERLACDDVGNPWQETCAADMGSLFECYQPSGECVIKTGADGTITTEYENGAKLVTTASGGEAGASSDGTFFSASGEECGTYHFEGSAGMETYTYQLTSASGETWTMTQDNDTGETTVSCANGQSFTMSRAQMDAFQACTDQQSGQTCTLEGGGGLPGLCDADDDCADTPDATDPVCCEYAGVRICLERAACEQAQSGVCEGDGDCDAGQECCALGGQFQLCVPEGACPE